MVSVKCSVRGRQSEGHWRHSRDVSVETPVVKDRDGGGSRTEANVALFTL